MIHEHSNATQTQWDKGEFQVMIKNDESDRPLGFCDGTAEDEEYIYEQAMMEGGEITIDKKALKTGREIWTIRRLDRREDEFM